MNEMKVKHSIWLLIATFLVTTGEPLLVNGLDLLGWVIFGYTFYKIVQTDEFKELF